MSNTARRAASDRMNRYRPTRRRGTELHSRWTSPLRRAPGSRWSLSSLPAGRKVLGASGPVVPHRPVRGGKIRRQTGSATTRGSPVSHRAKPRCPPIRAPEAEHHKHHAHNGELTGNGFIQMPVADASARAISSGGVSLEAINTVAVRKYKRTRCGQIGPVQKMNTAGRRSSWRQPIRSWVRVTSRSTYGSPSPRSRISARLRLLHLPEHRRVSSGAFESSRRRHTHSAAQSEHGRSDSSARDHSTV